MPKFYRRTYGRKVFRRRPRRFKKGGFANMRVGALARKAYNGFKYIRGLVNAEMYKYDTTATLSGILSTGGVVLMNGIAQGDSAVTRTGNSIFCRALNIKGIVTKNASNTTGHLLRISVVIDNQNIADTTPNFSDIYTASGVFSHLNPDTVGRFTVLRSHIVRIDSDDPLKPFEMNIPMKHHCRYNGTSASDIQRGAIFLVVCSSDGSNGPTFQYESRLSYHDN